MIKTGYKSKEDKIGKIRNNTKGTPMKLIAYRGVFDCDVEFQDDYKYVAEHALYQAFKKGSIKNPYDKTVFGIGGWRWKIFDKIYKREESKRLSLLE